MSEKKLKVKEGIFFSSIKETVEALSYLGGDEMVVLIRRKKGFSVYGLASDQEGAECLIIGAKNLGYEPFLSYSYGLEARLLAN
jgi:hypothetical protein